MSIFLKPDYGRNKLTVSHIMTSPMLFLAFGFGSGLIKKAPGTFGTIAAIPVYLLLIQTGFWGYSLLTLIACVYGVVICEYAANQLGEHDYGGIVWDEVAGFLITMWFVPFSGLSVVLGFLFFRLFDIVKPWPIKWLDQYVEGGKGIMIDDIVAGVFAALVTHAVLLAI